MEAVWNLEDTWKLSTKQALVLLLLAASGVCLATTATLLRRLKSRKTTSPSHERHLMMGAWGAEPSCGWAAIKKALMSSVRWSRASKWRGETTSMMMRASNVHGSWTEMINNNNNNNNNSPLPLLDKSKTREFESDDEIGWRSHNSESPVWQRPILMGEKCELPRFSGLILYDENGQLLCDVSSQQNSCNKNMISTTTATQEKTAAVRTTLRDLL